MEIIRKKISITELQNMAEKSFGNLVKAVVDIDRKIMAIDAQMHADEESVLLEDGSKQKDLWGINIYPQKQNDIVEFDSMVNLRPAQGNRTRGVDDLDIRRKIIEVIDNLIER